MHDRLVISQHLCFYLYGIRGEIRCLYTSVGNLFLGERVSKAQLHKKKYLAMRGNSSNKSSVKKILVIKIIVMLRKVLTKKFITTKTFHDRRAAGENT